MQSFPIPATAAFAAGGEGVFLPQGLVEDAGLAFGLFHLPHELSSPALGLLEPRQLTKILQELEGRLCGDKVGVGPRGPVAGLADGLELVPVPVDLDHRLDQAVDLLMLREGRSLTRSSSSEIGATKSRTVAKRPG